MAAMANPSKAVTDLKFLQITAGHVGLYGLGNDGAVWQYFPADYTKEKSARWAYWARLTTYGKRTMTKEEIQDMEGDR